MDDTAEKGSGRFESLLSELTRLRTALAERDQENACLEAIGHVTRLDGSSLEEMLQCIVDLVPYGFLAPERVAAQLRLFGDLEGANSTKGFQDASGGYSTPILAGNREIGALLLQGVGGTEDALSLSPEKRRFLATVADRVGEWFLVALAMEESEKKVKDLEAQLALAVRQRAEIQEPAIPVLEIWNGVLFASIVGAFDSWRAAVFAEKILHEIAEKEPYFVIVDVSELDIVVDSAQKLASVMRAFSLLGVMAVFTGIRPEVATNMLAIKFIMDSMLVRRNLQEGLAECIRQMPAAKRRGTGMTLGRRA